MTLYQERPPICRLHPQLQSGLLGAVTLRQMEMNKTMCLRLANQRVILLQIHYSAYVYIFNFRLLLSQFFAYSIFVSLIDYE